MEATRVYLRGPSDVYRPICWVHNTKPNEMLLHLYGLGGNRPTVRAVFPEHAVPASPDLRLHFRWSEATELNLPLDHITCHADGTFHVKRLGDAKPVYVHTIRRADPLGPQTATFLEFILLTDRVDLYRGRKKLQDPHVWFDADEARAVEILGMFSGANYPLMHDFAARIATLRPGVRPGVRLQSGTLQGLLTWTPIDVPSNRPRGTLISFRSPVTASAWCIKTFLVD